MPSYFFAFTEIQTTRGWRLADPLEIDLDAQHSLLVPRNIAPPWSWPGIENITVESGERGFPTDLSPGLRAYLDREWERGAEAFWPSWLSLAEIVRRLKADLTGAKPHFNPDQITTHGLSANQVRVVFWHA